MKISKLEKQLINQFQKSFPVCERPFLKIAEVLNSTEEKVLMALKNLKENNVLSRVGPVFSPGKVGESSLVALKIPPSLLEDVAEKLNALDSINHNYEREHEYNLWFVVTAPDKKNLDLEIQKIADISKEEPLVLPLEKEYFIDLGFEIPWSESKKSISQGPPL